MSVRTDKIVMSIAFLTDESKEYAKLIETNKQFINDIKAARKSGKDLSETIKEMAASGQEISKIPLDKLAPSQLILRAQQLKQVLSLIPQSAPEYKQLENEYQKINSELATMRQRTKGVSEAMNGARTEGGKLSGLFESIAGNFLGGGFLGIIQSILGGIFSLGKSAVKASADMETLSVTLAVLLKSGEAATDFLQKIQKFAAETPFEFPQLAEAGKKLVAFGYSGNEALAFLRRLGDVAAASGVPIEELAGIVGKAKLGQLIQGEELNQLADRGINVFKELAGVLGTTESKIKKLGSEGKISYADLEKAITIATDKGGQFAGLMDKQSKTLTGLFSTLSDNFGQFVQSLFGGVGEGIKPIVGAIGNFFGLVTDALRSGQKATGEYATAVNALVFVVKTLGFVFNIVWEGLKLVYEGWVLQIKVVETIAAKIADFISYAEKIPLLGGAIRTLLAPFRLLIDAIENSSATFAGFRAAAEAAVDNVKNSFLLLVNATKLAGKEIELALTFDATKQAAIRAEIQTLSNWAKTNATSFKSVGDAYNAARDAAIIAQKKTAIAEQELAKKRAEVKEVDPKDAEKAEKDRLKRIKDALDIELKDREIFFRRQELVNDLAFTKKEKTESDYNKKQLQIEAEKYAALIKIYDSYKVAFGEKSEQFRDAELKSLELQKKLAETNASLRPRSSSEVEALPTRSAVNNNVQRSETSVGLDALIAQEQIEMQFLQQKFANLALSEIDFENEKARIKLKYAEEALATAQKTGETEKGQLEKLNAEKIAADNNYHDTLRQNEQRTADLKAELEKVKLGLASEAFGVAIELLSQDEAARKKNATAIKAFQIAQITVDGISEIQAIWKNANANPINALIPGAGAVIAGVQTAIAVGRSVAAISKVTSAKFAKGGFTGYGGEIDETGYAVRGLVHEGEYVIPKRLVENPQFAPTLSLLETSRLRGFVEDGFVNTTPNAQTTATAPSVSNGLVDFTILVNELQGLRRDVKTFDKEKKSYILLSEFDTIRDQRDADIESAAL